MPSTTRNYEAMVILKSILPDDTISTTIDKLADILTKGGAILRETSRWGRRRLAYDIDKQSEGYYVIYYFTLEDGATQVLEALERACRFDENILRQMSVIVPLIKRGVEIKQIVPSPGWLSEYRFEPRPQMSRRPRPMRGPDGDFPPPPPAAPEGEAAPAAAPAAEPAPQA